MVWLSSQGEEWLVEKGELPGFQLFLYNNGRLPPLIPRGRVKSPVDQAPLTAFTPLSPIEEEKEGLSRRITVVETPPSLVGSKKTSKKTDTGLNSVPRTRLFQVKEKKEEEDMVVREDLNFNLSVLAEIRSRLKELQKKEMSSLNWVERELTTELLKAAELGIAPRLEALEAEQRFLIRKWNVVEGKIGLKGLTVKEYQRMHYVEIDIDLEVAKPGVPGWHDTYIRLKEAVREKYRHLTQRINQDALNQAQEN